MAEQSLQDRTEEATPRKREESRRKGQIAKSQEVGSAMLLLGAALALKVSGPRISAAIGSMMETSVLVGARPPAGIDAYAGFLRHLALAGIVAIAPALLALAGIGLAVGAVQARGTLTFHPLKPDFSRISPLKGLKKIFGIRSVVELLKALIKLAIVGFAVYFSLGRAWADLLALPQQSVDTMPIVLGQYAVRVLALAGLALLVLAAADYAWQVRQHEKQLRMTKEEVKRENKDMEGDPMIKARLRAMGRSLARNRMMRDVPTADVVITNPTHIAVALRYDPSVSFAPIVVALGQRKVAQRIKAIALESNVPVIENKPVARALFAAGRVGLPIPPEFYVAVAEILAFVYNRRGVPGARIDRVVE